MRIIATMGPPLKIRIDWKNRLSQWPLLAQSGRSNLLVAMEKPS
jgi:hypothetical protein